MKKVIVAISGNPLTIFYFTDDTFERIRPKFHDHSYTSLLQYATIALDATGRSIVKNAHYSLEDALDKYLL